MKRKLKIVLLSLGLVSIIGIGIFLPTYLVLHLKYRVPDVFTNPDDWELVFEDNFLGTELNTSYWSKNYHDGFPHGGHTHNHRGYMTEENVNVSDGILIIRAENETHPDAPPAAVRMNRGLQGHIIGVQIGHNFNHLVFFRILELIYQQDFIATD
ncbi:MAG: hypothetical protein ACTSRE_15635 [Promethearchaeota archaeon]